MRDVEVDLVRRVLIVGCGDVGRRVARLWLERGAAVRGLVRSAASAARLGELGATPIVADLDDDASPLPLDVEGGLLYHFAPPPRSGTRDPRLRRVLRRLASALPARLVLISTTGVYGDRQGAWTDESAPVEPRTDRAVRRLDAETAARSWGVERRVPVVVLRVAGIYGPDRLPRKRIESGAPVLDPDASPWSNRIHVDDLATICVAAAERGEPDGIYNVSDGRPGTMAEYTFAVADRLGLPRPAVVSAEEAHEVLPASALSFLSESRRIDNRKMLDELGVRLRYPTLEKGLEAIR